MKLRLRSHSLKEEMMTEYETIDRTPDNRGLISWLRELAKTDRSMALKLLVNGWPMSPTQAREILGGRDLKEVMRV